MQSNQLAKQEENSQQCGNPKKSSPQTSSANEAVKTDSKGREKVEKGSGGTNTPNSLNFDQFLNHLVFEKYTNEYKLDKKTRAKTDEIIQVYLKKHQELRNADPSQIHAMVRAAILIASKCQEYQTEGGKHVRGCGFTTSFLLRSKPQIQIEEFQQKLQELRLEANLEKVVNLECVNVENKLIIQLAFYSKFSKIWEGLKIEDRSLNIASSNSMKKLTWMIFIIAKMKLLAGHSDITETAILLFASIYWALILCPSDVTCALIEDFKEKLDKSSEEEEKTAKEVESPKDKMFNSRGLGRSLTVIKLDQAVRNQLSKTLSAEHSEQETDYMITCVRDMLLKMKQKGRLQGFTSIDDESSEEEHPNKKITRSQEPSDVHYPLTYLGMQERLEAEGSKCDAPSSKCLHGIFDQANLTRNVRLLDNYYQKQMTMDFEFDERYFINCNGLTHTPIKLISPLSYAGQHQPAQSPIKAENLPHSQIQAQNNNASLGGTGGAGGPQVRGLGGGLAALAAGKQHSWGQIGELATKRSRTYTDEAVLTFVEQPMYRHQMLNKPSHFGNLVSTANTLNQGGGMLGAGQNQAEFPHHSGSQGVNKFPPKSPGSQFLNKIYQKREEKQQRSAFGGGITMQRTLDFSTSLKEANIREQLSQQQGAAGSGFGAFPGVTPNRSQQMGNGPMQTPIGQMIQIRSWAVNLRDTVNLSDQTGFIASLYMFVPASKTNDKEFIEELGVKAQKYIMDHLDLLITKLAQNRVNPGANITTEKEKIAVKSKESIYKITCYFIEKFLIFERERYLRQQRKKQQWAGQQLSQISLDTENLVQILNHETFNKSCLVYAAMIHFHQIGESELTPAGFLDAINLPAFQLFRTFQTFMELQLQMPHQIQELFRDLERQLILHLVWRKDSEVVKNIKMWLALQNEPATFQEIQDREEKQQLLMMPLKAVFNRVYQVAANTLMELCTELNINERVSEIIWSVVKVNLSQETQILIGRHLDQLLMCAIYGVCKVHPDCIKPVQSDTKTQQERLKMASKPQAIKFNDIIDAYKKINKIRLSKTGCWQVNMLKSSSVSWVYIEVPYYRDGEEDTVIDIIQFYNKVYLETMKGYIIETKRLEMEKGSLTPVIKNHSFNALLTPGGREQPGIPTFRINTPLIDSVQRQPRNLQTIYINSGGVVQKQSLNPLSQFANAPNHSSKQLQPPFGTEQSNQPHKTPRYNALYAADESAITSGYQPNYLSAKSTLQERSQAYNTLPVHRLASLQNQESNPRIEEAPVNQEYDRQPQKVGQNVLNQATITGSDAGKSDISVASFNKKFTNLVKGIEEGRQLPVQPRLNKQLSMLDPEIKNETAKSGKNAQKDSQNNNQDITKKNQRDEEEEESAANLVEDIPPVMNDAGFYAMGHQMSFMQSPGKTSLRAQHSVVEQQQKNSEQLSAKLIDPSPSNRGKDEELKKESNNQ